MNQNPKTLLTISMIFFVLMVGFVVSSLLVSNHNQAIKPNEFSSLTNMQNSGLIENFPDVPIHPQAVLIDSTYKDALQVFYRGKWVAPVSVPELSRWYIEELQKDGWVLDIPPVDLNSTSVQYAELLRGSFEEPLAKVQLSLVQSLNKNTTEIEMSFPAHINDIEEEQE